MEVDVIYNKSCERMDELLDESIDIILTDPPWNVGKDYGVYKDDLPWPQYWEFMDNCFKEISRVGRGYLVFTYSDRIMWKVKPIVEKYSWQYVQMLVWYHRNGYGAQNQYFWNRRFVPVLVFKKADASRLLKSDYFISVITEPNPQSNWKKERKTYIVQHPVKLYEKILTRLPGVIVLDPFFGSGAVLKAAKQQGRHYIGYDINPACCKQINQDLGEINSLFNADNIPSPH